jgi:hypothetical protein
MTIHILDILNKDYSLLLGLLFELGDVADREYQNKPHKTTELKDRLIKLFDYLRAIKAD